MIDDEATPAAAASQAVAVNPTPVAILRGLVSAMVPGGDGVGGDLVGAGGVGGAALCKALAPSP